MLEEINGQGRIRHRAEFATDFNAEVEIEEFNVNYVLGNDFSFRAWVKIRVSARSRETNAYMRYHLELEIPLRDTPSIEIFGRDFVYNTNPEDYGNDILHETFVSEFRGTIQFEIV